VHTGICLSSLPSFFGFAKVDEAFLARQRLSVALGFIGRAFDTARALSQVEMSPAQLRSHLFDTRGATIKFFQADKGAPIKFRREWIDAFIDEHTVDPTAAGVAKKTKRGKRNAPVTESSGLRRELLDV
jgi:hypothetical protein